MMPELFNNKYRIESTRLVGYDYSQDGVYFVTICTRYLRCYFGKVRNYEMNLNVINKTIEKYWRMIPTRSSITNLDEFVVMPNHVHGIVIINKHNKPLNELFGRKYNNLSSGYEHNTCRDAINRVSTIIGKNITNSSNLNSKDGTISLARLIRWFKGRCTYAINKKYPKQNFKWQERYYDRIIEDELERIREYIRNNPAQ